MSESDKIVESVFLLKCEYLVIGRCVVEFDLLVKEFDGGCKLCGKLFCLVDCI